MGAMLRRLQSFEHVSESMGKRGTNIFACPWHPWEATPLATKLEEGRGFEPLRPCGLAVFKTAAIDHSAIPPPDVLPRRIIAILRA